MASCLIYMTKQISPHELWWDIYIYKIERRIQDLKFINLKFEV